MPRSNGESNALYVFDTCALIALLYKEEGFEKVSFYLHQAKQKKLTIFFNEINLGELYYRIWKDIDKKYADSSLYHILLLPIQLVSVDQQFIMAAATWKAQYAISYADAFVVETAVRNTCPIITGDPEFDKVSQADIIRIKK